MGLENLIQNKLKAMGSGLGCCTVAEYVFEIERGTKPIMEKYYRVALQTKDHQ